MISCAMLHGVRDVMTSVTKSFLPAHRILWIKIDSYAYRNDAPTRSLRENALTAQQVIRYSPLHGLLSAMPNIRRQDLT